MAAKTRAHYNQETLPAVEGGGWYSGAVAYATEQGIISGSEFTDYGKNASRGEMAFLFANALPTTEYKAINSITELPDVTSATKYGTFNPNSNISRAEAAAIINRVAVKSERKTLTLERVVDTGMLYETDPNRRTALAGDTFVKADGTKVVLVLDTKSGVLGYGQGVATDLGRIGSNGTVAHGFQIASATCDNPYYSTNASAHASYRGEVYYVNPYNGEGHWDGDWIKISVSYNPGNSAKGSFDGQLSKDKNFYNEGQSHNKPQVGDTVIKADGTKVVLKLGISDIIGAGQGVDIYTGTVLANGAVVKEGDISWFEYDSSDGLWYWVGPSVQ